MVYFYQEFGAEGCTMRFLLEWAWKKIVQLKESIDNLCMFLLCLSFSISIDIICFTLISRSIFLSYVFASLTRSISVDSPSSFDNLVNFFSCSLLSLSGSFFLSLSLFLPLPHPLPSPPPPVSLPFPSLSFSPRSRFPCPSLLSPFSLSFSLCISVFVSVSDSA